MFGEKYSKVVKNKKLLKTVLTRGLNIFLILLALNLLSINLAIVDSSFMLVSTIYVLLGVIIVNLPFQKLYNTIKRRNAGKTSFYKTVAGLLLIIFSFILLLATNIQMLWLVSIPLLISGIDIILQGANTRRKELRILTIASFAYVIFFMIVQTIPAIWYALQQFSLWFSSAIGSMIGKTMVLGPSTSGLWIVIIFAITSCCIFLMTGLKKKHLVLNLIGLLICWIVYLVILGFVEFESKSNVIALHYLLFIFCLIPTFLYLVKSKIGFESFKMLKFKDIKISKFIKNGAVWALVLLLLSSIVLTVFFSGGTTKTGDEETNILFYGQNMLGSWDVPEYGKYGKMGSGMFGLLPYYLTISGYKTELVVDDIETFLNQTFPIHENITRYVNLTDYMTIIESNVITEDMLNEVDIFVIINLNESFSTDEHNAIWNFVENGGSLLVLGDHTDIGGMQSPLNTLLDPVGISYRFDSALPIDVDFRWAPCYQFLHHPVTSKINSMNEIQISVGASLDISPTSFPMLIGRYGLSDIGDRENEEGAYLGDYEYNAGEQIGDIILASGAYYGDGKVMVFGDTSSFQNSAISSSLPLITSVFGWLNSQRTATVEYVQVIVSLLLLIGAGILFLRHRKKTIHVVFLPLVLCFALIIASIVNPIVLGQDEIQGNILYIDTSHGERFSVKPYEDDSLSGFMINFMRNDYLPLLLREFSADKIQNSKILLFNAPTKSFDGGEVETITQFIYDGGLVILATGYNDKEASMPLLREFGLDIYDIPLGPIPYVEEDPEEYQTEPRFVDSWPIIIEDDSITETFYSIDIGGKEYILMTFTSYGDGGLLFISDSEFLMDKNIESLYDYWPGNIQFLKNIIDEMISKDVLQ